MFSNSLKIPEQWSHETKIQTYFSVSFSNQSFPPCLATYASQKEWGGQRLRSGDGSDHKGPCVSGYRGDAQFYVKLWKVFFFFF